MSGRNRRFFDDDDDDDDQLAGWTRSRRSNGTATRDRRNGVSRDPLSEIKAVVEDDWRETLDDNFQPITLALDMLDTSSLGRAKELDNFKKTNQLIEQALQSTVNAHYQGFNSSVGTYGQITSSIKESQKQVRSTRDALLRAKVQLASRREDLLDMSAKAQQFQSMIVMLRQIADLKAVPETFEQQLSSKHFLQAGETLNNAIYLANREDLLEIPALSDIRQYLRSQAISLVEILVEELHNHLYLKSPYCDSRWRPYTAGQSDLPVIKSNDGQSQRTDKSRSLTALGPLEIEVHRSRQLGQIETMEAADSRHPEADSLAYIVILTQALYAMGKLPYALEVMNQRLSVETFQIVLRTTQEVRARHKEMHAEPVNAKELLNSDALEEQSEPLNDLLWTLFSKWDAMLQAHRALYDAVGSHQDRKYTDKRSSHGAVAYDFNDIWLPMENELKAILNLYLRTEQQGNHPTETGSSVNELFVGRSSRSNKNAIFSIGEASSDKEHPYVAEEVELKDMLQRSVPGLLSEKNESATGTTTTAIEVPDGLILLNQATPFNILILLQPTIAFLQRAKRIVPGSTAARPHGLSAFLDEFLESVFYPQLISAVDNLYQDALEPTQQAASRGGFTRESTNFISQTNARVVSLIKSLSNLLSRIPYNREIYAQTVLNLYANYYQRCASWLSSLTANEHPTAHLGPLKLGAAWANRQGIRDCWATYRSNPITEITLYEALQEEMAVLFETKANFSIQAEDLIQDSASVEGLVDLFLSITVIQDSLQKLDPGSAAATDGKSLQLSAEAQGALERLAKSFALLSQSILTVLRLEVRVHVLYHLQIILEQGNYNIAEKANEVDSTIAAMNSDLQLICSPLKALPEPEYQFLMSGLAMFMNEALVDDSSMISIMTRYGAEKLILDISALQQNLRSLVSDPAEADLSRALKFYEHFEGGAAGLFGHAKAATLEFKPSQAAKLMTLMYSVDLASDKAGSKDVLSSKQKHLNEQIASLTTQMTAI